MTRKLTTQKSDPLSAKPTNPQMIGIKLTEAQRELILQRASLPEEAIGRLCSMASGQQVISFTVDELDQLYDQLQDAAWGAKGNTKQKILRISQKVAGVLGSNIEPDQLSPPRSRISQPTSTVYQIKITLLEIVPAIWRRFCVEDCSLESLHWYLQTIMGWDSEHLYAFEIGGTEFVDFSFGCDTYERRDVCTTRLSDVLPEQNRRPRFFYEYDFGDSWKHQLIVEERFAADRQAMYPVCLAGERACPPEDCGGPWGYADFLEAVHNPDHDRHGEMLEWIGEDFDPEKFDVAAVNRELRSVR